MLIVRQSTARIVTVGPVLDADGVAVTGGVVGDFKASKNGGAPAALDGSATLTHRHTGFYSLSLTATDLGTVGSVEITIDDTVNACPMKELTVIEEAIYDALFVASANVFTGAAGASVVSANITQSLGVAVTNSDGTASAGGSTSITLASGSSYATDFFKGRIVTLVFGTGAGQSRVVTTSTNADPAVLTVHTAWATNPDNTSQFIFEGNANANVQRISENVEAAVRLDRACRSITKATIGTGNTTTSIVTSSLDPSATVTDQFKGLILAFDKDTTTTALRGQKTDITASTSGGVLTVTALTTQPQSGDTATIE